MGHSVYSKLVKCLGVMSLSKCRGTFVSENRRRAKFTLGFKLMRFKELNDLSRHTTTAESMRVHIVHSPTNALLIKLGKV